MRCYISLNITLQVSFSFHPLFLSFFSAFCHGLPCAFWHTKPVRSSTAFWWVSSDVGPCILSESQMCNNLYRVIPTHFSTSPGLFLHKIIYSLIWVTPFRTAHTRYHHLLFHCHEMDEEVFFENDGILGRQSRTSYLSSVVV